MRALVVTALILALPVPARAVDDDAPTVTVRAEKGKVQIGESFHLWVTVLHKPDVGVSVVVPERVGGFEVLEKQEEQHPEADGLIRAVTTLRLAGFALGKQEIAVLDVTYTAGGVMKKLSTDALAVEVVSVIGDGPEELRPIAPPVDVIVRDYTAAWIAGGVAAAAALFALGWLFARRVAARRRLARDPEAARRALPPDEHALERLRALSLDGEDLRPVYFALTEIVREYLGRRYGFDALELTTRELLDALDRRAPEARGLLADWLATCDLVKYAAVPVGRADAQAALEHAITIIERTRPAPAPAAAPAPPEAQVAA